MAKQTVITDSDEESDSEELQDRQYKVILLGNGAVGKTSLAHRFCDGSFSTSYKQTIGLDFFVKRLVLPGDINVSLQVWDIGGQSIGSKMISRYIYGSDAVILVYDITSYQSFQDLDDWLQLVEGAMGSQAAEAKMNPPLLFLMGNKDDLGHMRMVSRDKHSALCFDRKTSGDSLVSAKTGDEVATAFYQIAAKLAGITLKQPEVQVHQKVVKAELVDYPQDDPRHAHFTSENLAEKTRYSLGWCQAHETFREHIIDSPHRFLDILDHLSELCQLLEVPTTERSACRSSGMKSLGALISLLVQQRFNATSMPLQSSSSSEVLWPSFHYDLCAARCFGTAIDLSLEADTISGYPENSQGAPHYVNCLGSDGLWWTTEQPIEVVERRNREPTDNRQQNFEEGIISAALSCRVLSDLVSQLTLLDHAYARFENPFLAKVSGITSTMSVRITAIAGVMQEGSGEGVMSSRNFCRGNSFRRLREAAFLEEIEGLHTLIVDNLKKILADDPDPAELAVIELLDDPCMFTEDRIAVTKIVAVEVGSQLVRTCPASRMYSPPMLDVLLEQRKLALADITVKHFDVSVIDTARCMQEAPDEIVAQYSGVVPSDAIHHFCRIAGKLLTSYEALLSEVAHLCDGRAAADDGTTSPPLRALVGELVRGGSDRMNAQHSLGHNITIHPRVRSGHPQHKKKTRDASRAVEIESIDSGIEADSSSVNSDDACYVEGCFSIPVPMRA
ncbi:hypothetical protein FOZ61_007099 [Perkinsus olseni]|uniref:Uncharacterized protein n=1 Tax=Perkinsus olseni TaxID=32597 RepID=A0A7J6M989_PEROL|nr:hypothetical protein FOZ61_007099 [Perkinsus olseni]